MNGRLQLPSSLLVTLRSLTGLKVQVPSVPVQWFPTEDWSDQPAPEAAAPTVQAAA